MLQGGDGLAPLPRYVSLVDFESRYTQILTQGGANYGWYQGQFLKQVRVIYATQGIAFLPRGARGVSTGRTDTPLPR